MKINDMPEFKDKDEVLMFPESRPVGDAIDAMAEKNYGAILVTKQGKLSGIFTERDILRKVAAKRKNVEKTKLKDVMTANPKTATANDNVSDCLRRMSQGRFRHMPVIDEEGKVTGMLSQGDFVAFTMSDIITRLGTTAKAEVSAGRSTPFAIAAAIVVYTLGLVALVKFAV